MQYVVPLFLDVFVRESHPSSWTQIAGLEEKSYVAKFAYCMYRSCGYLLCK